MTEINSATDVAAHVAAAEAKAREAAKEAAINPQGGRFAHGNETYLRWSGAGSAARSSA